MTDDMLPQDCHCEASFILIIVELTRFAGRRARTI